VARPLVIVAGGGITGLAAAHRLLRSGRVDLELHERAPRTGGVIATVRDDGRVLESGPDCFLSTKPWARDLAVELGLEGELRGTLGGHRRSFVLRDRRLEPIPEGFHLLAPTLVRPFLSSRIVSLRGKLRAGLELLVPARPREDESLESFVRRRLGSELFERLVEPLVAGVYTADARELSLRATFPQFLDMEREHGSVARALWARRGTAEEAGARAASGARYGLFLTLAGGLGTLVERLEASLPQSSIARGSRVVRVERRGDAFSIGIESPGGTATERTASGVVIALPAPEAARILGALDGELARELGAIPYASAATVNLLFRREQVRHPLDGMGFVVPSRERRFLLACSFSSEKFEGRARAGEVLLRAFVGGATRRADAELPEEEIARRALLELRELLGIAGEPIRVVVSPFRDAMPQYVLGHLDRVAAIEARVARIPGLALAGNAYRGVGIPDCVRSADEAARRILDVLGS
jgi:oxygen-dependent protoporphyrinogen oxidase